MLCDCRNIDRRSQIFIRNGHAEVHGLAAGNCLMHRLEIQQITGYYFRAHVSQRSRALVFLSHHRTHSFTLLQQEFDDRASDRTYTTGSAGDQNGSAMIFPKAYSLMH